MAQESGRFCFNRNNNHVGSFIHTFHYPHQWPIQVQDLQGIPTENMNNVDDTLVHHRQNAMQTIQNHLQNPANNERRLVLNLPGYLSWRIAIDLMVSIDREVIQNPNLHQSRITYSWQQNPIPGGGRGGREGGRGRGGFQVHGDNANVYYGEGMTININQVIQSVGSNHGQNQQAQAIYGGQEVEEAYIAEEEEEEEEQERWERDPIHVFGNNTNVFIGDGMNITVNHQRQEAETIPPLEAASMDTEEERMRLLPCKRKGPM